MFPNLSRRIAKMYTWFGLVSIPLLTFVTTISIINVFSRGELTGLSGLEIVWIIVFAAAIEVNIVRLFYEWKFEDDNGAKWSGIGLIVVAGVALLLESLQQGIGFTWSNEIVKWVVAGILSLRVIVVVLLLAREGSRLGSMARTAKDSADDTPAIYACLVSFPAPIVMTEPTPIVVQEIDTPAPQQLRIMPPKQQTTATKIHAIIAKNPDITIDELARKAGVSVRTAQRHKPRQAKEA